MAESNKTAAVDEATKKMAEAKVSDKKKEKKEKPSKKGAVGEDSDPLEMSPAPEYISHRMAIYEKLRKQYLEDLEKKEKVPIKVTLRDGKVLEGKAWETTPLQLVEGISKSLASKTVIAKVDGHLWDLTRPLEGNCRIELLDFDDIEAQKVFWHSSAHMLGEACERHFGCLLEHGPPTEDGFFYDMRLPEHRTMSDKQFPVLEKLMNKIKDEKQDFERLVISKNDLLEMFKYNDMKLHFIREKIPDGESSTVYRCGPLIDLCLGPHVINTNRVKASTVYKTSSAYWLGKAENEALQRVYGISFPDAKLLKEWEKFREEAAKRDHRVIGRDQDLFFFHELSPGSCFFLPHGTRIYNTLVEFIRNEYWHRGFEEVVTPNIYNTKLWEMSGHWQNYQENMFSFPVENDMFAVKPMNCPGHCLMFKSRPRTHRDLPIRYADFGVLHRNEMSGALTGLTRVRRFQQDDAHIFCTPEQIMEEMSKALDFLKSVYQVLGFTLHMSLSTRPEKFLGEIEVWDKAEAQLKDALNQSGFEWKLNPGDGAFYGPKIDITIQDAMRRRHQCATIQLDFQLPIRFQLRYFKADGSEDTPVIIHRAILGSVERMFGILTENYGGKWPFWLSPRQVSIVAIDPKFYSYCDEVEKILFNEKFYVEVDNSSDTFNNKIRKAQLEQNNFILIVGEQELKNRTVNVRTRDNVRHGEISIDVFVEKLKLLRASRSLLDNVFDEKKPEAKKAEEKK